jgi:hypothetical protein
MGDRNKTKKQAAIKELLKEKENWSVVVQAKNAVFVEKKDIYGKNEWKPRFIEFLNTDNYRILKST